VIEGMRGQADRALLAVGVVREIDLVQRQGELADDQHYD
jgi:hypothetical protein